MHCICKGLCERQDFKQDNDVTKKCHNSFKLGYKRCRKCAYFIKTEGAYCPCCQTRLAIGPRNAKSKRLHTADVGRY